MKKKTVVFIQNIEYPQQGAVDIYYYSKFLSKYDNIKVKVIVSKINEKIENKNLEIIELGKISSINFLRQSIKEIRQIKEKEKIDYVYFFAQNPFSVLTQFYIKYFLKIKTIYDVVSGPIGKGIIPFIAKITIKTGVFLADKYVVLDKGLITRLNLPTNKEHTIVGMGYDKEVFKEKNNINLFNKKENEIIFTYIGALNKERKLDIFLKAFIKNLQKNKNIKLYFIGYGNDEDNLKEIAKTYINKNIFFLGKKEHNKIPDYINSSDILVSYVPKIDYFEYQPPTKLIEYLACNKPVIATNTIAQQEILKGYEFLLHKDDLENTKEKINYFIENINTLRNKNYKKAVENLSWDKLVEKIEKLI